MLGPRGAEAQPCKSCCTWLLAWFSATLTYTYSHAHRPGWGSPETLYSFAACSPILATLACRGDSDSPCPATLCSVRTPQDTGCSGCPPAHRTDRPLAASLPSPLMSYLCLLTGLLDRRRWWHCIPQGLAGAWHNWRSVSISWADK